jgi:molybdopterin converting factor subunit 1
MLHWRLFSKQQEWLSIIKRTMIKVRLFSSLKEIAGKSLIELHLPIQSTAGEVYDSLLDQYPALERYRSILLVAINQEYASWEDPVGPDDEIAFFPPVSGGER